MLKRTLVIISLLSICFVSFAYQNGKYETGDFWDAAEDMPLQAYASKQGDFKKEYSSTDPIWFYLFIPYTEKDITKAQRLPQTRPYADKPTGSNGWWLESDYPMGRVGLFDQGEYFYFRPLDGFDIVIAWQCPQDGTYTVDVSNWTDWRDVLFLHSVFLYHNQSLIYEEKGFAAPKRRTATHTVELKKGDCLYYRVGANNHSYAEQFGNIKVTLGTSEEIKAAEAALKALEDAKPYRVLHKAEYKDWQQAERINYCLEAFTESTGSFSDPPWSSDNIILDGNPNPHPLGSQYMGWNTGTFTHVDPKQPYVLINFPYSEPIEFDTMAIICKTLKTEHFRPHYKVEAFLDGQWSTIFIPETFKEADSPLLFFKEPVRASAIRFTFIAPSPNNYHGITRLWVFGSKPVQKPYQGGTFKIEAPGHRLTEGAMVFQADAKPEFKIYYTPKLDNASADCQLKLFVTDYYGEPVTGIGGNYSINTSRSNSLDFQIAKQLEPGPYYLVYQLENRGIVWDKGRFLFGFKGCTPLKVALTFDNSHTADTIAQWSATTGQFDGTEQYKSEVVVEAAAQASLTEISLEFFWTDIEPLPYVYNFKAMDAAVKKAIDLGLNVGLVLYSGDNQTPAWMRGEEYAIRDQYGRIAWGRNPWKGLFFNQPSVHSSIWQEHFPKVWEQIAARYGKTGVITQYGVRPPLLECFYFDMWGKDYFGDKTGAYWDYSEPARQEFIIFLREYKGYSLSQVNARYGTNYKEWEELQLPQPKSLEERPFDTRPLWLDFNYFKYTYTPQKYYVSAYEAIRKHDQKASLLKDMPVDESPLGQKLARENNLMWPNYSLELGNSLYMYGYMKGNGFSLDAENGGIPPSFDALGDRHFHMGIFCYLPYMHLGSTYRWQGAIPLGEKEFNDYSYWKAWDAYGKIVPALSNIEDYQRKDPSIAIVGGMELDFNLFEDAKPIRRKRQQWASWEKNISGIWGGLGGVLKAGLYYSGLLYDTLETQNVERDLCKFNLLIDSGSPYCDEKVQEKALEFVRQGGKLVLWSNSFRFDDEGNPTNKVFTKLGIEREHTSLEEEQEIVFNLPAEILTYRFYRSYPVNVQNGRVVGKTNGIPAAWLINYGEGQVLFINGLPIQDKIDEWTPALNYLAYHWSGIQQEVDVQVKTDVTVPNVFTYILSKKWCQQAMPILNFYPGAVQAEVIYKDVIKCDSYDINVLYKYYDSSKIVRQWVEENDLHIEVYLEPSELMLLKLNQ